MLNICYVARYSLSGMDELDEFNEAPHSLRSETSSIHHLPPDDDEDDDDGDDDDHSQNINILDRTNPGRIDTNDLISTDLLVGSENDIVLSTDDLPCDLLIDANNHNNTMKNNNIFEVNNSDQRQLHQNRFQQTNSSVGSNVVTHNQQSIDNAANESVNNWLNGDITIISNNKSMGNNNNSHIA